MRSVVSAASRSPGVAARTDPEIIARHDAKVYGKAAVGAPPMSVPHLDTRYVGGQRSLMFGPYAGWSPKFLKSGRYTDLFASIKPSNLTQMMAVAPPNLDLMVYLGSQLVSTHQQRFEALLEYMPSARPEDWEPVTAGQRCSHRPRCRQHGWRVRHPASPPPDPSAALGASPAPPAANTC